MFLTPLANHKMAVPLFDPRCNSLPTADYVIPWC